jgi:hypothetical protein
MLSWQRDDAGNRFPDDRKACHPAGSAGWHAIADPLLRV